MAAMDVPGLALAIVDRDGFVLTKGYGVRRLGSPGQVDADTLFDIASITKPFTATAAAMLVDEGRLRWDTKVQDHLPNFKLGDEYVSGEFQLADALSHRGGFFDNYFYDLRPTMDRPEFYERLGHSLSVHPFRTAFHYNNAVFALVGDVVAAVTGESWDIAVDERILAPLGMDATVTRRADALHIENRAVPHHLQRDGMAPLPPSPTRIADAIPSTGAILSSASDMAKWCRFQLRAGTPGSTPAIAPETVQAMRRLHVSGTFGWFSKWGYGRQRAGYGLGWMLLDYRDDADQHVAHGGATPGMQAWMVLSPKHGYAIAMMSNGGWAGDSVHFAIANWIHDHYLGLEPVDWAGDRLAAHRAEFDSRLAKEGPKRAQDPTRPPSLPIAQYVGTFDHGMYGPMVITLQDGALAVRMGVLAATAVPWGGDTFHLDWDNPDGPNGMMTFDVSEGRIIGMTYDEGTPFSFTVRAAPR